MAEEGRVELQEVKAIEQKAPEEKKLNLFGTRTQEAIRDNQGFVTGYRERHYSLVGRKLQEETAVDTRGQVQERTRYWKGEKFEQEFFSSSGQLSEKQEFSDLAKKITKFNNRGQETEIVWEWKDSTTPTVEGKLYEGVSPYRVLEETTWWGLERTNLQNKVQYEYGAQGLAKKSQTEYEQDFKTGQSRERTKRIHEFDRLGREVGYNVQNFHYVTGEVSFNSRYEYTYDAQGRKTEERMFSDGNLGWVNELTYDKQDRLHSRTGKNVDGSISWKETYQYKGKGKEPSGSVLESFVDGHTKIIRDANGAEVEKIKLA